MAVEVEFPGCYFFLSPSVHVLCQSLPTWQKRGGEERRRRDIKKRTASIKTKITPAIVQVSLLGTHADGLDQTHLARCGTEVLEAGHELDQPVEEGHGGITSEAGVLAEAEGTDGVGVLGAVGVELGG